MAYNEEENIQLLLDSVLTQKLSCCVISGIVIISSGSTDRTDEIIKDFSRKDPRIELIIQPERLGKASAVNLFLKNAKEQICLLVNSDSSLDTDTVEFLIKPFNDPDVGMTGGRPIPLHYAACFANRITNFMWGLHHDISLRAPKMGEIVAFRKDIVQKINENTAVDEVYIEWQIKNSRYKTIYVPEAKLYIRTPDNIKDFISQRRRIAAGHLWAGKVLRYSPSTRNMRFILRPTFKRLIQNPRAILFILAAVFFECLSRILGGYDYYIRQRNPYIWKICLSTKSKPGPL